MALPIQSLRLSRLHALRALTPFERRAEAHKDLSFWTNLGLAVAVLIGIAVIFAHGGNRTSAIAAFGGALGVGAVLGFLFGVPSHSGVNVNTTGTVAVAAGADSKALGGNINTAPAATPAGPTQPDGNPDATDATTPPPAATATDTTADAPDPIPQNATSPSVSNLEQVADWITKLLLGGGLTQITRIPPKVWQWAGLVALAIGVPPATDSTVAAQSLYAQALVAQQAFAAGLLVYAFILGFFSGFLITRLQLGKVINP